MKNLIDVFPIIEEGFPNEADQHALKLVLLAEEITQLSDRVITRDELEKRDLKLTLRFGAMLVVGVGVLATLMKLL